MKEDLYCSIVTMKPTCSFYNPSFPISVKRKKAIFFSDKHYVSSVQQGKPIELLPFGSGCTHRYINSPDYDHSRTYPCVKQRFLKAVK